MCIGLYVGMFSIKNAWKIGSNKSLHAPCAEKISPDPLTFITMMSKVLSNPANDENNLNDLFIYGYIFLFYDNQFEE